VFEAHHQEAAHPPWWAWLVFGVVVLASLAIDLFGHRGNRGQGKRHGALWSAAWIGVSLLFAGWVALEFGKHDALEFLTAYVVEKSLSVDNLFVFLIIFARLKIPQHEQHRVLFWGIVGAFVTRAIFVVSGTALLARWHILIYAFGVFLIYTGIKTLRSKERENPNEDNKALRFLRRHLPLTEKLHGHAFTVVEKGKRLATPLLLAVLAIELTDILFAVDSIAAVLAISKAPYIVFTSNIFAILGLRALYLVLADLVADLKYLQYGLGGILMFVGAKMLLSHWVHIPHWIALLITIAILVAAVVPSLIARRRRRLHRRTDLAVAT